jgi:hypothetical protein
MGKGHSKRQLGDSFSSITATADNERRLIGTPFHAIAKHVSFFPEVSTEREIL